MASYDKEIASLSKSTDLSATARKAKLESEKAMAEQRRKSAEENKARLEELEKARKQEAINNATRTKEQQQKISEVAKASNAKIEELKKVKTSSLSALGKIGVIETKKGAIVDIQNNVLKEQAISTKKIKKDYGEKIDSIKNAPYRIAEKNADGSVASEAIKERNKKVARLEIEMDEEIEKNKKEIAAATYESQADIVYEIIQDLGELKDKTFYASTLDKNLRVKIGNYDRSTDGWQIFYTVLCDGITLLSAQDTLKYGTISKLIPSNMDKYDAIDMYDSLFKCGDPVLSFGINYTIDITNSDYSKYEFKFDALKGYDTNSISVNENGSISGREEKISEKGTDVVKEMKPAYKLEGIVSLMNKIIEK